MRIDIVGLTLAETALVLLFAIFAALLARNAEETRALKQLNGQREQIAALQGDLNSERHNNADLAREMVALLPKLRSTAFPSCAEIGKTQGWLFTATVRGRDTYDIDGTSHTLDDLLKMYSTQLREAEGAECRQRIKLYVGAEVSGSDYEYGMRIIAQHFYVGYMGSR